MKDDFDVIRNLVIRSVWDSVWDSVRESNDK